MTSQSAVQTSTSMGLPNNSINPINTNSHVTVGQLVEALSTSNHPYFGAKHPFFGKYVIVRAEGPGVHWGLLKEYDPALKIAYLENARHLWFWTGFTLYSVANQGMATDDAMISQICPEAMINNTLTLIPCSEKAVKNLLEYPAHLG
jgi:hypothetical protein